MWGASCEVDGKCVALYCDPGSNWDGFVAGPVVVKVIGKLVAPVWNCRYGRTGNALGVGDQSGNVFLCGRDTPPIDQLLHAPYGGAVCRDLRGQVAPALLRCANIAQDQVKRYLIQLASIPEFKRGNDDTFLVNFGRHRH